MCEHLMYPVQCAYKVSKKYCHHSISGEIKKGKLARTRSILFYFQVCLFKGSHPFAS